MFELQAGIRREHPRRRCFVDAPEAGNAREISIDSAVPYWDSTAFYRVAISGQSSRDPWDLRTIDDGILPR